MAKRNSQKARNKFLKGLGIAKHRRKSVNEEYLGILAYMAAFDKIQVNDIWEKKFSLEKKEDGITVSDYENPRRVNSIKIEWNDEGDLYWRIVINDPLAPNTYFSSTPYQLFEKALREACLEHSKASSLYWQE